MPGVVTPRTLAMARDILAGPDGAGVDREPRVRLSAAAAFARLSHRAQFHPGRSGCRTVGRGGQPSRRRSAGDRISRRPRRGRQRAQIPRDDDRRPNLSVCIWRYRGNWKVHYFTSDMADKPDHRRRKRASSPTCRPCSATRPWRRSNAFATRLGLDYAGIDFGIGPDGDLLLFEANATMVIAPPDADERWAYRRAAIGKIVTPSSP